MITTGVWKPDYKGNEPHTWMPRLLSELGRMCMEATEHAALHDYGWLSQVIVQVRELINKAIGYPQTQLRAADLLSHLGWFLELQTLEERLKWRPLYVDMISLARGDLDCPQLAKKLQADALHLRLIADETRPLAPETAAITLEAGLSPAKMLASCLRMIEEHLNTRETPLEESAVHLIQQLLSPIAPTEPAWYVQAHLVIMLVYYSRGEYLSAIEHGNEVHRYLMALPDEARRKMNLARFKSLFFRAVSYRMKDQLELAKTLLAQALKYTPSNGWFVSTVMEQGSVCYEQREYLEAYQHYRFALEALQTEPVRDPIAYHQNMARLLLNSGKALMWLRDYPGAQAALEQALTYARQIDSTLLAAYVTYQSGLVEAHQYRKGEALRYLAESLRLLRAVNPPARRELLHLVRETRRRIDSGHLGPTLNS